MEKPSKLYYSIAEVAEMAAVKAHVLRYWETEFPQLRPKKNRAGNRTYREREVKLVLLIKRLLYDDGFTIRGALKRLREKKNEEIEQIEIPFLASARSAPLDAVPASGGHAAAEIASASAPAKPTVERTAAISHVRRELESILADLSA